MKIQSNIITKVRFGNQKSKEKTARMALWNMLKIPTIYTMEASFCGCTKGSLKDYHFTANALKEIGRDLCRCLITYCDISMPKSPIEQYIKSNDDDEKSTADIIKNISQETLTILNKKSLLAELGQMPISNSDNNDPGSDSDPSDGNLNERVLKNILPIGKNGKMLKGKTMSDSIPNDIFLSIPKIQKKEPEKPKKEESPTEKQEIKQPLPSSKNKAIRVREDISPLDQIMRSQIIIPQLTKPNMHDKATQFDKKDFTNPRFKVKWKGGLKKSDIKRNRAVSVKSPTDDDSLSNLKKSTDSDSKAVMYLSHYSSGSSPRKIIDGYSPLGKDKKWSSPQSHKTY